jgi:hypothetical protein
VVPDVHQEYLDRTAVSRLDEGFHVLIVQREVAPALRV